MEEILRIENIAYSYDIKHIPVKAIKQASGVFHSGKLYAITGRSGSGKSTLISLMAGLDLPMKGKIFFKGKPLDEIERNHYRSHDIGMIFQAFNLMPHLTAAENTMLSLDLGSFPRKDWKNRVIELLQKVGIDEAKSKRKAIKLSGGEQQRVAIARALGPNPPLLLADEPTGNLDSETGDTVMKLLLNAARNEGKCVIAVTHSKEVAKLADEVWAMKDGVLLPVKVD
jgi:putative ABC transport system ATP-binding protein